MKQQVYQHHSERSFEEGNFIWETKQITKTRTKQLQHLTTTKYLVKWKNLTVVDSTWKDESFIQKNPQLIKH